MITSYYIACAVCIIGFCFFSVTAVTKIESVAAEKEVSNEAPVIVLDAGHGGEDGGASSPDGVLEKDINLAITLQLNKLFKSAGYKTVLTRSEDISIYDSSAKTTREKKVSDVHKRAEIINSSKNNILISIHQNKFENSKYYGTQIFYSPNSPESLKLAESIKSSVVCLLQPDNKRETKKADGNIYILNKATVPAVIVECGFLSNSDELLKLRDENYQKQMAFSVFCGFLDYYYGS